MQYQLNYQGSLGDSHQVPHPVLVLGDKPIAGAAHNRKKYSLTDLNTHM